MSSAADADRWGQSRTERMEWMSQETYSWKTFEALMGGGRGYQKPLGVQTREKLKSSHLDQGYQSIVWLFWQFNYFAILDSLCLFYFCDMPMNHKPCYANSFSCKNQRFTQESSLGMRELITGMPNTPTVMMRIVLLGWESKKGQPHKVSHAG